MKLSKWRRLLSAKEPDWTLMEDHACSWNNCAFGEYIERVLGFHLTNHQADGLAVHIEEGQKLWNLYGLACRFTGNVLDHKVRNALTTLQKIEDYLPR